MSYKTPRGECVHCKVTKFLRPRGLCYRCYYTPGVKDQYPSYWNQRGTPRPDEDPDFNGAAKPCQPTASMPGTEEKIRVLMDRVAAKEELHHPEDAQGDLEPYAEVAARLLTRPRKAG